MNNIIKIIITVLIISIIYSFLIGTIFPPYLKHSWIENRTYATLDLLNISLQNVKNGQLFNNINKIFEDQFLLREKFVELYSWIQYKLGKKKINDRIIGSDNYSFIIDYPKFNKKYINNVNDLGIYCKDKGIELFFTLIPTKDLILIDKIDEYYRNDTTYIFKLVEQNLSKNVHFISLYNEIKEAQKSEPQYYKTDHHWNTNGVFTGYNKVISSINNIIPQIGMPHKKEDFLFQKYQDIFLGSSGRVLTKSIAKEFDDIVLFYPKFESDIKAESYFIKEYPVYHMDKLSYDYYNNDYGVFLGGAELDLTLKNSKVDNNKKAIVVGISFAPPLTILLAEHFNTLDYIDLRYTGYENLYKMIEEKQPDAVIFLYYNGVFNDVLYSFN